MAAINIIKSSNKSFIVKKSHEALLRKYNIDISKVTNDEFISLLPTLKDKLSDSYISTIISTIKLLNPDFTLTAKELKLQRRTKLKTTCNNNPQLKEAIESLIRTSIDFIVSNNFINVSKTTIDAKIAIVTTFVTNLRAQEIKQLTISDLESIAAKQPVYIKIKKRNIPLKIVSFGQLYDLYWRNIQSTAQTRNKLFNINDDKLINVSIVAINTYIREYLIVKTGVISTYGLQILRKFNTTNLIELNEVVAAQALNRHKDIETTLEHYNDTNSIVDVNAVFS